mgnify:CR=1 FL=1
MNMRIHSRLTLLLAVLLSNVSVFVGVAPVAAQNVGRVGAVNQDATGTPPGNASRMLAIGTHVVHKERIQTSLSGSTQILFPDTSTLSVGRNSNIVIDEYVYDQNAGTGRMVASVGKGVLRFVGGQISHTAGVTIKTPVATLGIRGGVVTIVYPVTANYAAADPNIANCKGELIVGHVGSSTIRNSTGSTTVRPGFATCVTGPNDPIPEPFRVSDALLAQIMSNLTSKPGQSGGAIDLPTDQMASRQGLGVSTLSDPAHPPGADPLGYVSIFDGGNELARNKAQAGQAQQQGQGQGQGQGSNTNPNPGCYTYCQSTQGD